MENLSNKKENSVVNGLENVDQLKVKLKKMFDDSSNLWNLRTKWGNKLDFLKGRITKEELLDGAPGRSEASEEDIIEILEQIKNEQEEVEKFIIEIGDRIDNLEMYQNSDQFKMDDKNIENETVKENSNNNQVEYYGDTNIKKSNLEVVNKSKIDTAQDLRQLVKNLNEIGDIAAPDGYIYTKDFLIDTINNLKGSNDENIKKVTNIHGLRDTVKKLLLQKELGI